MDVPPLSIAIATNDGWDSIRVAYEAVREPLPHGAKRLATAVRRGQALSRVVAVAPALLMLATAQGVGEIVGALKGPAGARPSCTESPGPKQVVGGELPFGATISRRALPAPQTSFNSRFHLPHSSRGWTGARTPSAIKRVRQAQRRRLVNQPRRTAAKTLVAKALVVANDSATNGTDAAEVQQAVERAVSALDRAAKIGAIHRNAADRRKSRLMLKVNAALGGEVATTGTTKQARQTSKAAAAKQAKARIAASRATKAKGAQTAAGKARAALAKTSRGAAAAETTEVTAVATEASTTKTAAKATTAKSTTSKATKTTAKSATKAKSTATKSTAKAAPKSTAKKS